MTDLQKTGLLSVLNELLQEISEVVFFNNAGIHAFYGAQRELNIMKPKLKKVSGKSEIEVQNINFTFKGLTYNKRLESYESHLSKGYLIFLNQLCIAQIFNLWEDKYRKQISDILNIEKINSDLFSDLNKYRQAITHNRGLATSKCENKIKLLKSFKKDQLIDIPIEYINEILVFIQNEVLEIYNSRI